MTFRGAEIDLAAPWRRLRLPDALEAAARSGRATRRSFGAGSRRATSTSSTTTTWAQLIDHALSAFVEPALVQPTILHDYPIELSPFARETDDDPSPGRALRVLRRRDGARQRLLSEINDAGEQAERFAMQQSEREAGDVLAEEGDPDYVEALSYGMPPTGGLGLGIDRLGDGAHRPGDDPRRRPLPRPQGARLAAPGRSRRETPVQEQKIGTILWRGKWLMLISLAVCVALAVFITKTSAKVYQATAIIQVNAPSTQTNDTFQNQQASQGLAKTYATLITDRSFLDKIRDRVGNGRYSVGGLKSRISASAVQDTTLVRMKVEESSPAAATSLASDVAQAFLQVVRQDAVLRNNDQAREIQAQITRISDEIDALSKSGSNSEKLRSLRLAQAALTDQLGSIVGDAARQGGIVSLSAPPTASSAPIRPRPALNVAAGVMLGLLLGIVLAWFRSRLDRALRSPDEAEELLAAPVLSSIPLRKRYSLEDGVLAEAYDVLRANLAFLSLDQALHVVTFTSFNPSEGKTASVEGLAYAAVRGGMSVLLIDGDVRTNSLSTQFGARGLPGLTSVIVGTAPLDEAVLEIVPGLSLLPAGPTPPNPPSLLSSGRMREVMAELREQHNLIIVDSPPVAHLADASILAAISDGIVLVARVGVTNRADLPAAAADLRHSPTPIVGTIVLSPQMIDETYYPTRTEGRRDVMELVD